MTNLNAEMIEKAKEAKTAEELLKIAETNGVEMTAEEAGICFDQINASLLDDDLLEGVAGGWIMADENKEDDSEEYRNQSSRKGHC